MNKVIEFPVHDELSCTSCGVKQRTAPDVPCILCGGKLVDGDPHPWAAPAKKDVVR